MAHRKNKIYAFCLFVLMLALLMDEGTQLWLYEMLACLVIQNLFPPEVFFQPPAEVNISYPELPPLLSSGNLSLLASKVGGLSYGAVFEGPNDCYLVKDYTRGSNMWMDPVNSVWFEYVGSYLALFVLANLNATVVVPVVSLVENETRSTVQIASRFLPSVSGFDSSPEKLKDLIATMPKKLGLAAALAIFLGDADPNPGNYLRIAQAGLARVDFSDVFQSSFVGLSSVIVEMYGQYYFHLLAPEFATFREAIVQGLFKILELPLSALHRSVDCSLAVSQRLRITTGANVTDLALQMQARLTGAYNNILKLFYLDKLSGFLASDALERAGDVLAEALPRFPDLLHSPYFPSALILPERCVKSAHKKLFQGWTLLHTLVVQNNVQTMRFLLGSGLRFQHNLPITAVVAQEAFSLVFYALCLDHLEMLMLLVSAGANLETRGNVAFMGGACSEPDVLSGRVADCDALYFRDRLTELRADRPDAPFGPYNFRT